LDGWYAQSHPDEDFAETFAVWLDPRSNWRKRYARWPALRKLEYVDTLMGELAGSRPTVRSRATPHRLSTLRQTLRSHYESKRERYAVDYPSSYDDDLRELFTEPGKRRTGQTAMSFLRTHRREIRELVARWTGEHQFSVDQVLNEIMIRCRRLGLRATGSRQRLKTECAVWVAVHTVHRLRRQEWHVL
ncbi:MAG: hypothetical protein R3286_08855, partial [Gammaproteobacteria bacterium]|nr:hypothetical protein [Gammaproteobacteria bacterium]